MFWKKHLFNYFLWFFAHSLRLVLDIKITYLVTFYIKLGWPNLPFIVSFAYLESHDNLLQLQTQWKYVICRILFYNNINKKITSLFLTFGRAVSKAMEKVLLILNRLSHLCEYYFFFKYLKKCRNKFHDRSNAHFAFALA